MLNMRDPRLGLLMAVAAAILFTQCGGTPGKNLPVTEEKAIIGRDGVQEINVQVESYYFKPNEIHVVVDKPVRLVFKSGTFIIPHNFMLNAPEAGIEVDQDIGHGATETVEFTPTKVGEYQFVCHKKGHAEKGMVGTLVVEAKS